MSQSQRVRTCGPPQTAQGDFRNAYASTEPLPLTEWTPDALVNSSPNFKHIPRIPASLPIKCLLEAVVEHEESGIPLIIEGWHEQPDWNAKLFSIDGFIGDDDEEVDVRNIETSTDLKMSIRQLLDHYQTVLIDDEGNDNKLYGKDIPCPATWEAWLRTCLPEHFHPCSTNDLFSCLDEKVRPETLMCYIGIGDTFTPAHKDLCGSFGHNLMCHTTNGGSAFWFMSCSGPIEKDMPSEYFRTKLKQELDRESHKASIKDFQKAPFDIYIAEQRVGDFILVPPRCCHQVVNRGGITMKMSWSRMGVKSFEYSLQSELLIYHRVCRRETYRVKLTLHAAVKDYARRLTTFSEGDDGAEGGRNGAEQDLKHLVHLLDRVLIEEWSTAHASFAHIVSADEQPQEFPYCHFCGADIFQSFFACNLCSDLESSTGYVCCPLCLVEGRSCRCGIAHMTPFQTWPFDRLIEERNNAVNAILSQEPTRIPQLSHDSLDAADHPQIFEAACMLHKRMQAWINTPEPGRVCNPSSSQNNRKAKHVTGAGSTVLCKPCHRTTCFLHHLERLNVHAAEIILLGRRGPTPWHKRHSRQARSNVDPDSYLSCLARVAKTYSVCSPIDAKRYKHGFYDKLILLPAPEATLSSGRPDSQLDFAHNNRRVSKHILRSPRRVESLSEVNSSGVSIKDLPSTSGELLVKSHPITRLASTTPIRAADKDDSPLTELDQDNNEDIEDIPLCDLQLSSPQRLNTIPYSERIMLTPTHEKIEVVIPHLKRGKEAEEDEAHLPKKRIQISNSQPRRGRGDVEPRRKRKTSRTT